MWAIGIIVGKLVWHLIKVLRINEGLDKLGLGEALQRGGHKLDAPLFFYELVKWIFIVIGLALASNALGLDPVEEFLTRIVNYLPQIFVAAVVLLVGVMAANFVERVISVSVKAAKFASAHTLASIAKWSIIVVSLIVALQELGVGKDLIDVLVMGVVIGVAAAFALAFGLGGKSHAEEVIAKFRKHHSE